MEKNFQQCIELCTGDVIAISDQDDVWMPEKLETQVKALRSEDAVLVFHNSTIVNESLEPIADYWSSLPTPYSHGTLQEPHDAIRELVQRNIVQGATILFDADIKPYLLPIPKVWHYDCYIALVAALLGRLYDVDKELLKYRQHEEQVIGSPDKSLLHKARTSISTRRQEYENESKKWWLVLDRLLTIESEELIVDREFASCLIRKRMEFERNRAEIYHSGNRITKRIHHIIKNVFGNHYSTFGNGWKSATKDALASVLVR